MTLLRTGVQVAKSQSQNITPSPVSLELSEIWLIAVETWLSHIENNKVEKACNRALKNREPDKAIQWLINEGYDHIIGLIGVKGKNNVHIDVSRDIQSLHFIKVYYPDWNTWVMDITLLDILIWLKDGKKQIRIQLNLL